MDRFPESYEKPVLLSLDEGMRTGWTAACSAGNGATSGGCGVGSSGPTIEPGNTGNGRGFIDPEILQGSH